MSTTCAVCCDSFNKSNRAHVKCPYCEFDACATCHERYICETPEDAHCMSCRKGWTRETLVDNFTQKFVSKKYKERREELLFEREKSLMPATQPFVEIEKEIRSLNPTIARLRDSIERAGVKYNNIHGLNLGVLAVEQGLESEFRASIFRRGMAIEQLKLIHNLNDDLTYVEWTQEQLIRHLHGGHVENERRLFVRACPYTDCKGFLSTAWKCGLCENWTCPRCHEVKGPDKDAEHTCDPGNVATAELLAKDSRNCPKCAAMIFKINGCDQMYCTQCHTAFSWRTGRVESGTIHNPHYYEYMRTHGGGLPRARGDVPCGGFPTWGQVARYTTDTLVSNAHMLWGHLQWILPRYEVNIREDNRDLRIKFMIGDFTNEEFKKRIQQREKARQRKTDIRNVVEMLRAILVDLFQDYVQTRDFYVLQGSLIGLRQHYNDTLDRVSRNYGKCAVPKLRDNFTIG